MGFVETITESNGLTVIEAAPVLWLAVIAVAAMLAKNDRHAVSFALSAAAAFAMNEGGMAFRWQSLAFCALCIIFVSNARNFNHRKNITAAAEPERLSNQK